jgi:hypothetical protein
VKYVYGRITLALWETENGFLRMDRISFEESNELSSYIRDHLCYCYRINMDSAPWSWVCNQSTAIIYPLRQLTDEPLLHDRLQGTVAGAILKLATYKNSIIVSLSRWNYFNSSWVHPVAICQIDKICARSTRLVLETLLCEIYKTSPGDTSVRDLQD